MSDERMALLALVEKGAVADLVRDMLALAADRIMEVEVKVAAGAAHGARSPLREGYRNGYCERGWDTRAGPIELAIPRLRKRSDFPSFLEPRQTLSAWSSATGQGSDFPSFLEPCRTAEKALVALVHEAYVGGISRRAPSTIW